MVSFGEHTTAVLCGHPSTNEEQPIIFAVTVWWGTHRLRTPSAQYLLGFGLLITCGETS